MYKSFDGTNGEVLSCQQKELLMVQLTQRQIYVSDKLLSSSKLQYILYLPMCF